MKNKKKENKTMYQTTFKQHFGNAVVVIIKDNKEEFIEIVKSFIGPNSGWYSKDFGCYIDRFFDEDIDACQIK